MRKYIATFKQAAVIVAAVFISLTAQRALADVDDELSKERQEAREWYQDAKFGVFVTWGIYSLLGGANGDYIAEWVMEEERIPINKYRKLAENFNPTQFDAEEWAQIFEDAGAKYVTFVTKHHDGFAMFDSKVSAYDIVDATPFARDIVAELKNALDKRGIKLFMYYSQVDWYHPDYFPRGRFGQDYTGRDESHGEWNKYLEFQNAQIKELATQYGDIAGFWFDGWWDREYLPNQGDWRLQDTYNMIRSIQPGAIISNNHHQAPFPNEDTQLFERDLPGECNYHFCTRDVRGGVAHEMVETLYAGGSWGWDLMDDAVRPAKDMIQTLVRAAGHNANFTLSTGPMPNGKIEPEHIRRYLEIGQWLKENGESVYGTRGGPLKARPWGVTTQKDDVVYVHILDALDTSLAMNFPKELDVKSATYLGSSEKVPFTLEDGILSLSLSLDKLREERPDLIVKLRTN